MDRAAVEGGRLALGPGGALLILDKAQKATGWAESVKRLWNEDTRQKRPLTVVLRGSAPLLVQHGLLESLAGRFEMPPPERRIWPLAMAGRALSAAQHTRKFWPSKSVPARPGPACPISIPYWSMAPRPTWPLVRGDWGAGSSPRKSKCRAP